MLLIPAIDLKDGHCVRLKQGDMDLATVFSEERVRHQIDPAGGAGIRP
jgi:phosphoribosylformimino-5-aminoimidazole carboxamide ribonucleotide (ProFAR) isomerase